MDYFITTYFSFYEAQRKRELAIEFVQRYPQIILLQPSTTNDKITKDDKVKKIKTIKTHHKNIHMQWILFNEFVKSLKDFNSITLFDADLILPENYFEKLKITNDEPKIVQGFSRVTDEIVRINGVQIIEVPQDSIIKNNCNGNSGHIWTFNKKAIDKLGPIPIEFYLGGFDFILANSLLKNRSIMNIIDDYIYKEIIQQFYNRCNEIQTGYINANIIHKFHGLKQNRRYNSRWKIYEELTEENVKSYWESRREL